MSNDHTKNKLNVLGTNLQACCFSPKTGFYRDGYCRTDTLDRGRHVICAEMTDAFLSFTAGRGNDLSTPREEVGFPGLQSGDRWCLCALRWREAWQNQVAPPVILEACDIKSLDVIPLNILQKHAIKAFH